MHWSPEMDLQRQVSATELTQRSNDRLASLVWSKADLGAFGLGTARSLSDYAAFSGIDYENRTIAAHAFKDRHAYG